MKIFVRVLKSFSTIDAKIDADCCVNNFFVSANVNGANILTISADADAVNIILLTRTSLVKLYWEIKWKSVVGKLRLLQLLNELQNNAQTRMEVI